jgi:hypothetical protein
MTWTYTYHKFNSKSEFINTCSAANLVFDESYNAIMDRNAVSDIVDKIYKEGTYDSNGNVLTPPVLVDGFHVNIAWAMPIPSVFESSRVYPKSPSRVWA